ncbi:alpha/beta hydrolase [Verrucomicrobiales bacterium BCK34]|nr:alpha/beta hydrolase [Verrucomicrobiales bacterium BCK34]
MSDSRITFVEHAGHRIACIAHENEEADRLPVVWIHGLTMSVRFWEKAMYEDLENHRSWYSVSLPFHYPSTFDGDVSKQEITESLLAELLAKPVDALIPEGKFHLVGHSLGGFVALNYAAKFPDRVASIVSIGGFATGKAKGLEGALQFLSAGNLLRKAAFFTGWWILKRHAIFLKLASLTYARKWRRMLSYPHFDPTMRLVFPDVQKHPICALRAFFRYLIHMNILDEADQIHHPVLVMAGLKDPIIPAEHQINYAGRIPTATLDLFEGVGHLIFAEAPEEFERRLIDWLDQYG